MTEKRLVIILGQLRASSLTFANFKTNVLDELGADLAVCVPNDSYFSPGNPYYHNAKYRWLVPDREDMAIVFDMIREAMGAQEDWRPICDVQGSWIGRIKQSGQPGAASILFVLRWFMLANIESAGLLEQYDRFIITRSDFFYLCPHPPVELLDPQCIWIPNGEDYGGFTDRHLVVSSADLRASCDLIDRIMLKPTETRDMMVAHAAWNIEQYISFHYRQNGLIQRVRRFPYVMYLVRAETDGSAWAWGALDPSVGMIVKYPSELIEARKFEVAIKSREDWTRYFDLARVRDVIAVQPALGRLFPEMTASLGWDEMVGQIRAKPDLVTAALDANQVAGVAQFEAAPRLLERLFDAAWWDRRIGDITDDDRFRFLCFALPRFRRSKSQLFQDLWVLFELGPMRNGYFVEFGAGDGVQLSNSYLLEKEFEWSGVVAEANEDFWASLAHSRSCHVCTKCVTAQGREIERFNKTRDPIYSALDRFSSYDMHGDQRKDGERVDVETISLLELLESAGAPERIDYMSVDAGGVELEVLESFDFQRYDVRLLSVQHNWTSQQAAIDALMAQHGYVKKFDTLSKWESWFVKTQPHPVNVERVAQLVDEPIED